MSSQALSLPQQDRGGGAPSIKAGDVLAERRPVRLQRSRKRGARTPPDARYVGRPTMLGNPFLWQRFGHARAVKLHRAWLAGRLGAMALARLGFCPHEIDALTRLRERVLTELAKLRGVDLQCWCPISSRWCHADELIARANHEIAA